MRASGRSTPRAPVRCRACWRSSRAAMPRWMVWGPSRTIPNGQAGRMPSFASHPTSRFFSRLIRRCPRKRCAMSASRSRSWSPGPGHSRRTPPNRSRSTGSLCPRWPPRATHWTRIGLAPNTLSTRISSAVISGRCGLGMAAEAASAVARRSANDPALRGSTGHSANASRNSGPTSSIVLTGGPAFLCGLSETLSRQPRGNK